MKFDVYADDAVVVPLDAAKFLGYVLTVVIGHCNVPAPHDNIHATSLVIADAMDVPRGAVADRVDGLPHRHPIGFRAGAYLS